MRNSGGGETIVGPWTYRPDAGLWASGNLFRGCFAYEDHGGWWVHVAFDGRVHTLGPCPNDVSARRKAAVWLADLVAGEERARVHR